MTADERRIYRLVEHANTTGHESGHASAAVVLGFELVEVSVVPGDDDAGRVRLKGARERPRDFALVALAGPLSTPGGWVPRWPLLEAMSHDEAALVRVTKALGYGREEWDELKADALYLIATEEFCSAEQVFKIALGRCPELKGELLAGVLGLIQDRKEQLCSTY